MNFEEKKKVLTKIIIDLGKFKIDVFFGNSKEPSSLIFDTPSRQFYCSVIALIVIEMKKNNNLRFINIRTKERVEKLRILDQKLSGKNTSSEIEQLFEKIRTAWRYRLRNIEKHSSFNVTYCSEKINFRKMDEYAYGYLSEVAEVWPGLFGYDKHKKWNYRFNINNAAITLDDVRIFFGQSKDERAWERFIDSLTTQKVREDDEEKHRIDPDAKVKDNVLRFLEDLEDNNKTAKLFNSPGEIILQDQYIPIQVVTERIHWKDIESFGRFTESEEEIKKRYIFKDLEDEPLNPIPWEDVKINFDKIMVLADPGMGKTTLLKMEAIRIAQQEIKKLVNEKSTVDETIFPIFLRLYDLSNSEEEIIDAIPKLIKRDYPKTSESIEYLLRQKLKKEKCILLLDALDEVPKEHRNILSEKLNRFARNYSTRIISASRIVGYGGTSIHGAKEVEILPFSQNQIESYVKTWFNNAIIAVEDKSEFSHAVLHELKNKPQTRGLAQNPLLLSFICSLYQEKKIMHSVRRVQIYEEALQLMMGIWSQRRRPSPKGRIIAKTLLLQEIAYGFSCDMKEIFFEDELYAKIEKFLQRKNVLTDFRDSKATELMEELSEEDGILQKIGRDGRRYTFLHRTFQEYLTALYLKNAFQNNEKKVSKLIKKYLWDFEWHETFSLLAGIMNNPLPLIKTIIVERDDIFSSLLILSGRCIAESKENNHPIIVEVINKLYEKWKSDLSSSYLDSTIVSIGQTNSLILERLSKELKISDNETSERIIGTIAEIKNENAFLILTQALRNKNSNIRKQAALDLDKFNDPKHIKAIIEIFDNSDDSEMKARLAYALGHFKSKSATESLIKALNDEDDLLRMSAAYALGKIGDKKATISLVKALIDPVWGVRKDVAEALGKIGGKLAIKSIIKTLREEPWIPARVSSAKALGEIGCDDAVNPLIETLLYEDDYRKIDFQKYFDDDRKDFIKALSELYSLLRYEAAESLGKIGSMDAIDSLRKVINSTDVYLRRSAILALGKIQNESCLKDLINALYDNDSEVRLSAAFYLGQSGNVDSNVALKNAAKDKDRNVRWRAIEALSKINNSETEKILLKGLNDLDEEIQLSSLWGLGEIGNPKVSKTLMDLLINGNHNIKKYAAAALGKIGYVKANRHLVTLLKNTDEELKEEVVRSLIKIGTLETLKILIQDSEIDVYDPKIFSLARGLAIRFCKEDVNFIPVYEEEVEKFKKFKKNIAITLR